MTRMHVSSWRKSWRAWAVAIGPAILGLSAPLALACSMAASNSGSPTPPAHVAVNTTYFISGSVNTSSPCTLTKMVLYSDAGGTWHVVNTYPVPSGQTSWSHTWSVTDQANGTFDWEVLSYDSGGTFTNPSIVGPYYTP
jgi:hypothetical protein